MDLERHNSGMAKKLQPKPPNMPFEDVVDRLLKPVPPKPKQDKGSPLFNKKRTKKEIE